MGHSADILLGAVGLRDWWLANLRQKGVNVLPRKPRASAKQLDKPISGHCRGGEPQLLQPPEDPQNSMKTAAVARRQNPAPMVVDNDHGAGLGGLNDGLHLAAISNARLSALDQEDVGGSLVVVIAGFDKSVIAEDRLNVVLHLASSEQLRSNSLGEQDSRKEPTELGQQTEMVKGNHAGCVYRADWSLHLAPG